MGSRTERPDVLVVGDGLAAVSAALHVRGLAPDSAVALWTPGERSPAPPRPGVAFAGPSPDLVAARATRDDERLAAELRLAALGLDALEREVAERHIACGFRRTRVRRDPVPDDDAHRREQLLLERRFGAVDDAVFDEAALLRGLVDAARAAGVAIASGPPSDAPGGSAPRIVARAAEEGARVEWGARAVEATRVVLATETWLGREDAFVGARSLGARIQTLALGPPGAFAHVEPRSLGPGFAVAAQDLSGRLLVAEGNEPSNRGDPLDAAAHPAAQARLEEWAAGLLGREDVSEAVVARGARPALYTRDALPLVGPHPGRASCLLAAGFSGLEATYGVLAGRIVAEIVVLGRAAVPDAPRWSPRRLL